MDRDKEKGLGPEKRSEPRKIVDDYYSVEISISRQLPLYQFRVRDISPWGLGILVKEESPVLKHLAVGDVVEMKYNPATLSASFQHLKTEIRHITWLGQGRFKGHYLMGLRILERTETTETTNASS
jgi:hypothetical protein